MIPVCPPTMLLSPPVTAPSAIVCSSLPTLNPAKPPSTLPASSLTDPAAKAWRIKPAFKPTKPPAKAFEPMRTLPSA